MKRNNFAGTLTLLVFFLCFSTLTGRAIGAEQKSPLSTPRMGASAVAVDGEIYVIGGMTKRGKFSSLVDKYNPSTNKWSKEAPMPTAKAMAVAVAIGKKIYVLGGRTGSGIINKVEIYDTESKSWKKGKSMPVSRWYHMATAHDQKIYVIGGIAGTGGGRRALTKVETYDSAKDTWSEAKSLPTAKQGGAAVTVEGKIYAIGGRTGAGNSGYAIKSVDIYDPLKNSWSLGKAMPQARTGVGSAVIGNKIYVVGGAVSGRATNSIDVYDLSKGTWSKMTSMKYARTGHCVCAIGKKKSKS
jgi:N-acetylneuraminic acid mutarotase